jgi:hypothetical protein
LAGQHSADVIADGTTQLESAKRVELEDFYGGHGRGEKRGRTSTYVAVTPRASGVWAR